VADPIQGYFDSTSFTLDVNGFPIWNRAVGSTFMAKFAHTVLGNGAAAVTTGGFQVVKKTGMTVTVKPYFICKDGYMMYQTAETDITFTSSVSEQVFYIGARLDVANNHFTGDNVAGYTTFVSATDLASCKLTITANAVTITDGMIEDLRYNTAYCGQIDEYRERSLELIAELELALEVALAGGIPAHASTHAAGGGDPITPASIGALSATTGTWTPTISAATGTLTTKSVTSAYYDVVGNFCRINITIVVTNKGTGTNGLVFTLPVTASSSASSIISGRESAVTGKQLQAMINASGTTATAVYYDNSDPLANGATYTFTGSYQV
jgi:hypothetical protein